MKNLKMNQSPTSYHPSPNSLSRNVVVAILAQSIISCWLKFLSKMGHQIQVVKLYLNFFDFIEQWRVVLTVVNVIPTFLAFSIWTTSWENLFMPYTNNKDADQPEHLRSLISTLVVRCLDSIMPTLPKSNISRLLTSLYIAEQAQFESYLVANSQRHAFSWCGSYVREADKAGIWWQSWDNFPRFSMKMRVFDEAILMNTHKICFYGELKIIL